MVCMNEILKPNGRKVYWNKRNRWGKQSKPITPKPYSHLFQVDKKMQPLLHGTSQYDNQHILFIDFDKLPNNFRSYDSFAYAFESHKFNHVVFRTASDKVKFAIVVSGLNIYKNKKNQRVLIDEYLTSIGATNLIGLYDQTGNATDVSFLTETSWNKLAVNIPRLTPLEIKIPYLVSVADGASAHPVIIKPYRRYTGQIPNLLNEFINKAKASSNRVARKTIVQVILASYRMKNFQTYAISSVKLELDFGIEARYARRVLQELVELGYLTTDGYYVKDKIAKSYGALNELLDILAKLYPEKQLKALTDTIADGSWNKTLYFIFCRLPNAKIFTNFVRNVTGVGLKDRAYQANHLAKKYPDWNEEMRIA